MTVMHVLRKAAAPAAAAGLAVSCLLTAGAPALAVPATLHIAAPIGLGKLGKDFTNQFTEDPAGNVFYSRGSTVYEVKITASKPNTALRVRGNVLAVAASPSDLFVDVGRTVTEYKRSNRHRVRSWTLSRQPGGPTSAGILVAGSTVWAWTDWATDESGFQYASVSRFTTGSPVVHKVASNNVYPADMAADSTGLYFEAVSKKGANYIAHATPSGAIRRRNDANVDAPLAVFSGDVYLLAVNETSGNIDLDSFTEPNLGVNFSARESSKYYDMTATILGVLVLGGGKVSLVLTSFDKGQIAESVGIRHAVTLLPGPESGVITASGGKTYLVRVFETG
jgi:hypothetical protein